MSPTTDKLIDDLIEAAKDVGAAEEALADFQLEYANERLDEAAQALRDRIGEMS